MAHERSHVPSKRLKARWRRAGRPGPLKPWAAANEPDLCLAWKRAKRGRRGR